jgi:16S rRNA (guanine(966)-N(2))-methyltransferase RsmD
LDLFSGSGSLGIECYSRGSKNITFVEKNKKCIKQLYSTTKSLNIRAEIILNDVFKYIRKTSKKFDLVFADPPYDFNEQDYLSLIKEIQKNILRNQESILVLEHFKKKTFSEIQGFMFLKNYGDCSFSFINQKSG